MVPETVPTEPPLLDPVESDLVEETLLNVQEHERAVVRIRQLFTKFMPSGFAVGLATVVSSRERIRVAGRLGQPKSGDVLTLLGEYTTHPKYGRTFKVHHVADGLIGPADAILAYLVRAKLPGIGPKVAHRLVSKFGDATLDVLDHNPEAFLEVAGINEARLERLKEVWKTRRPNRDVRDLMALGLTASMAERANLQVPQELRGQLRENPWLLALHVTGIGFAQADRIARALKLELDQPCRWIAGLKAVLDRQTTEGHLFSTWPQVWEALKPLLSRGEYVPQEERGLDMLQQSAREDWVRLDEERIYRPWALHAEVQTAYRLARLVGRGQQELRVAVDAIIAEQEGLLGFSLTAIQRQAVHLAAKHPVVILTGGAGTGKTVLLKVILALFQRAGLECLLCAPTGQASSRMRMATAAPASTMHQALGIRNLRFASRNLRNPLEETAAICDEMSMVDMALMYRQTQAMQLGSRMVMVGDVNQLESVGPGDVLRQMIDSGRIPVVRLTYVHRQKEGSRIASAAQDVCQGKMPVFDSLTDHEGQCFFRPLFNASEIKAHVMRLVTEAYPKHLKLDPSESVQVLTPVHQGTLGTNELNAGLQHAMATKRQVPIVPFGHLRLAQGDRVRYTFNNRALGLSNGDLGVIQSIAPGGATIRFLHGASISLPPSEAENLTLAYAGTIHSSEGSQYPVVVVVLHHMHYVMLRRSLLYTAMSRAQRLLVVIGTKRAMSIAVNTSDAATRRTCLAARLIEFIDRPDAPAPVNHAVADEFGADLLDQE